jgi:hypothetical protein
MANSLGSLTPGVITRDVLDSIVKQFPLLSRIARDFSGEAANFGEAVKSRVVTNPTVSDYNTTGGGYVAGNAATVDVPVTINQHKHVTLNFGEQEISGTNRNLIGEQIDASAYALGRKMIDDLYAVMTPANFPAATNETVEALADVDRDTNIEVRRALRSRGVMGPYFGILNDTAFANLTKDAEVSSRDYVTEFPDYDGGVVRNVGGIRDTFEDVSLPANSSNVIGFYGSQSSLVVAARVPKDPATDMAQLGIALPVPGTIDVVTHEATGLQLMQRYWYDMSSGKLNMTLTWMYGVAKGVANNGELVVTSTNVST